MSILSFNNVESRVDMFALPQYVFWKSKLCNTLYSDTPFTSHSSADDKHFLMYLFFINAMFFKKYNTEVTILFSKTLCLKKKNIQWSCKRMHSFNADDWATKYFFGFNEWKSTQASSCTLHWQYLVCLPLWSWGLCSDTSLRLLTPKKRPP